MKDPKGQKIFGSYKNIMSDAAIRIRDDGTTLSPAAAKWLANYVKVRYNVEHQRRENPQIGYSASGYLPDRHRRPAIFRRAPSFVAARFRSDSRRPAKAAT